MPANTIQRAAKRLAFATVATLLLTLAAPSAFAQQTRSDELRISVIDAESRQPIEGFTLFIDGAASPARTSRDGTWRATGLSGGAHSILARRLGYVESRLTLPAADTALLVALVPAPHSLDATVIT